jgi:hypothetical protein
MCQAITAMITELFFLTISDNILIVGGSTGGKKQANRPQPQSGSLPDGAGGGTKNGALAVLKALRNTYRHRQVLC